MSALPRPKLARRASRACRRLDPRLRACGVSPATRPVAVDRVAAWVRAGLSGERQELARVDRLWRSCARDLIEHAALRPVHRFLNFAPGMNVASSQRTKNIACWQWVSTVNPPCAAIRPTPGQRPGACPRWRLPSPQPDHRRDRTWRRRRAWLTGRPLRRASRATARSAAPGSIEPQEGRS